MANVVFMARRTENDSGQSNDPSPSYSSPGQLYREISISRDSFENSESKLTIKPLHPFVRFCKRIYKAMPSLGKGEKLNDQNRSAIEFLGWELTGEEFGAAYKFTMFASFIAALIVALIQ